MKEINLNKYQMLSLIEDKELKLEDCDDILEISENEIQINHNGEIYKLFGAEMVFKKQQIEFDSLADELKEVICEYFNLEQKELRLKNVDNLEYVFTIRFSPNCESKIFVCPKNCAVANTKEMRIGEFDPDADQVGIYKRMGTSDYYFRWLGDEV